MCQYRLGGAELHHAVQPLRVLNLGYPLRSYVYITSVSPGPCVPGLGSLRLSPARATNTTNNQTTVVVTIAYDPFAAPAGILYSYTIIEYGGSGIGSASAPLFSLAPYPTPIITAVAGCSSSPSDPLRSTGCMVT